MAALKRACSLQSLSLAALLFVACTGCLPTGEDSWGHYQGGGHYPARSPSMSPDGSAIVFSSPRSGHGDIYQINRDGSQPVRLTDSSDFETDPVFTPDGTTIAFAREADGIRHIWLMNQDGSNQRQLTSGRVLDDPWMFTPDGSELFIWRSPLSLGLGRTMTTYAVNLLNGKVRQLEALLPEYSPDGRHVAYSEFSESNGREEIWLMNADGTNKHFLVSGHSPRFSPDGNTVLFSTEHTNPGSLWRTIDIDGSNNRKLGRVEGPMFAPDGEHIVCLSPEWQREIWKLDLDGSHRERLQAPTGYISFFRPCRDGFIFNLVTDDRVGEIYVINTDDWTVERVTSIKTDAGQHVLSN